MMFRELKGRKNQRGASQCFCKEEKNAKNTKLLFGSFLGRGGGQLFSDFGFTPCVIEVSGYRYRGPGFDPRRYQIF